ncbi:MAG: hypothetical protein JNL61_08250 [Rhizobiaceae bacterium]|nr:hypothetical protein [Rhizobiaceae bacterium]
MKVSLYTFLRNGVRLGYQFEESIRSALPLADEYVVALGPCDDDTRQRLVAIGDPRIRIIDTTWNEAMRVGGFVYGQQKMLAQANCSGDWAFYLEADEVLHEKDIPAIRAAMETHLGDERVEALVFDYYHFYGSPDWLAVSSHWYRRAPRIIRNTIRSVAYDGLFFNVVETKHRTRWPRAALANAHIYHYGHVRSPEAMADKRRSISTYWEKAQKPFKGYRKDPAALARFTGTHPAVMHDWFAQNPSPEFSPGSSADYRPTLKERRYRLMMAAERLFSVDLSKKHFRLVR